jgi:hypothetical protein
MIMSDPLMIQRKLNVTSAINTQPRDVFNNTSEMSMDNHPIKLSHVPFVTLL